MKNLPMPVLILLAACGSDEAAPSCQQAVTSFYDTGCVFGDLDGNELPPGEAIDSCKSFLGVGCDGPLEDFLFCLDEVDESCDCTQEQDDVIRCLN